MSRRACIAKGALLAWFAVVPAAVKAQDRLAGPAELHLGDKGTATVAGDSVITLGTSRQKVDLLLGAPRIGSTINVLQRSMYTYADGTIVTFVDGGVISVSQGGLAEGNPSVGFFVKHQGKLVFIDPMTLRGVPLPGPLGDKKRDVEECFIFIPPIRPPWESKPSFLLPPPLVPPGSAVPNAEPAKRVIVY